MKTKIKVIGLLALVAVLCGSYVTNALLNIRRNLVTLDVRNMDVREVVRKMEWQTWETIYLNKDVEGKVTLNVRNAPLEAVLDLVAGQVAARSSHIYPIYRQKSSLQQLQALLQQESSKIAERQYWTNLFVGGRMDGGGPGFRGGLEGPDSATNTLINLQVKDKEPNLAAVTLSAASRVEIVPEDGATAKISMEVKEGTREEAVKAFANALHRKWDDFYVLRAARFSPGRSPGEGDQEAMRERMTARMEAMTPEQRASMEEMRNLTPEERQTRMQARMEDPAIQQRMSSRMLSNIRNSTPEQIVQQKRERMQRMQNRPQGQGGPGPRQ